MVHALIEQLHFARSEFLRGIEGVTDEEARRRFMPMNCISWNVGHLASQEQRYWLGRAQGRTPLPAINEQFATGAPGSTPPLDEMMSAWRTITADADAWLDTVTTATLELHPLIDGSPAPFTIGSLLLRMIYHYWFHNGENSAIRQELGHVNLPEFVGDIDEEAPFRWGDA